MKKYLKFLFVICLMMISITSLNGCASSNTGQEKNSEETNKKNKLMGKNKANNQEKMSPDLSNDWKSNQIQIDGVVYTSPINLKDLESIGYTLDYDGEYVINPGSSVSGTSLINKEGETIGGTYKNCSEELLDIHECWLDIISIKDVEKTGRTKIVFPGNIRFGSTVDEVIAAYGEPSRIYESNTPTYRYSIDSYHYLEIGFDEDGEVISYYLSNSQDNT